MPSNISTEEFLALKSKHQNKKSNNISMDEFLNLPDNPYLEDLDLKSPQLLIDLGGETLTLEHLLVKIHQNILV